MRFYAADGPSTPDNRLPLERFHEAFAAMHPYPALTLRAADRLCAAGRLVQGGLDFDFKAPVTGNRYICTKTLAELDADLQYGTFDFIVDGLPAVREALVPSIQLLSVTDPDGKQQQGSAVAHLPNFLLTARHCVEGMSEVLVHAQDGSNAVFPPAKTLFLGEDSDVAGLLLGSDLDVRALRVRAAEVLEPVLTLGFPRLQGLEPALIASGGEVAGTAASFLDGQRYWITTCAMTGGSSGGPVVGADGCIVGLVSSFPASDAGIDPGRFGLMAPALDAVNALLAELRA
jgi:hypothetical protein